MRSKPPAVFKVPGKPSRDIEMIRDESTRLMKPPDGELKIVLGCVQDSRCEIIFSRRLLKYVLRYGRRTCWILNLGTVHGKNHFVKADVEWR